jgi:hypothetical protein
MCTVFPRNHNNILSGCQRSITHRYLSFPRDTGLATQVIPQKLSALHQRNGCLKFRMFLDVSSGNEALISLRIHNIANKILNH